MPTRDEMTRDEKRKEVKLMASRYQKATRKERSELLTEMEYLTSLHRKHLTRLLNGARDKPRIDALMRKGMKAA